MPLKSSTAPPARIARFWSLVDRTANCWEWQGSRLPYGHGHLHWLGQDTYAHHVAWVLATGALIPDGLWILHTCDNPACVRNDEPGTYEVNGVVYPRYGHLFLGTARVNTQDAVTKGRHVASPRYPPPGYARPQPRQLSAPLPRPRGSAHRNAKLTEPLAQQIRIQYAQGGVTLRALAEQHHLGEKTVHDIIQRRTWRHVP